MAAATALISATLTPVFRLSIWASHSISRNTPTFQSTLNIDQRDLSPIDCTRAFEQKKKKETINDRIIDFQKILERNT